MYRAERANIRQEHLLRAVREAASVRVVAIPQATHWVHLDRGERGRDRFLREVTSFLATDT